MHKGLVVVAVIAFVIGGLICLGSDTVFQEIEGLILIATGMLALVGAGIIRAIHHPAWQQPMRQAPLQPQQWPPRPPHYQAPYGPSPMMGAGGQ